jgi:hypothetical protein
MRTKPYAQGGTPLGLRAQTWPTPRSCSAMAAEITDDAIAKAQTRFPNLETVVTMRQWPTPNVPNGGRSVKHAEQIGNSFYHEGKKVQYGLESAVRMWPTPVRRDSRSFKGAQHMASWTGAEGLAETVADVEQTRNGALNPTWVEWLMGFPLGWTDCGDSATPSSRKSRSGSGGD